jgi:DNA-binding MarR family transcriptional regulator
MSTTPLTGQVIGRAHYATRALLERAVAPLGVDFPQVAALNALADDTLADDGAAVDQARLVHRMTSTLKIDEAAARAVLDHLVAADLATVDAGSRVRLTDAGRSVQDRVRSAVAALTARLYADIPTDEMSAAGRVLALVTQRADAELASTPA